MTDILTDIFATLSLKGALYFRTDFSGAWGVAVPNHHGAARFHLVVQGGVIVTLASGKTVRLGPGDLILIPAGAAHTLSDREDRAAPPLETVLADAGYDGGGVLALGDGDDAATTQLICGHFTFRDGADHPLLRALPDALITTAADRAREPWLDETLRLIARRIFEGAPGAEAAVTRLSEAVYIELMRLGLGASGDMVGVLAAMQDKQISRALKAMHAAPHEPWSVEKLAGEAAMSRSRFAERFRALLGVSPMGYLSEWRLQKALALLDQSRCSVQEVASRSGYQSPAAFTRAFAAKFGASPTEFRRASA